MAEKHDHVQRSKKALFINNFVGGVGWSFGAVLGTALLLGVLGIIAKNVDLVPIVGSFVSNIIDYILTTNHNIQQ